MRMWRRNSGFTLIELMIVVTLVAIIATIAVPSFQGLVESNRQKSTTNSVLGILNYARSEAVRRGEPVAVRAVNGSLQNGLEVVYTGDDGAENILRTTDPMPGSVALTKISGDMPVFRGDGMKNRQLNARSEFKICPGNGDPGEKIVVNAGGQTNRSTDPATCP
ncbi:GspH/FimT family pseudopilin [Marinobacter sp.]|uniref:GspH/FimT family pseudopilin n=1 Tax=Marinobacter sp. TaxID=50741 RepID=UPI0025B8AF04|nr:GspH/FimT family pseudopilin [Marinobacter sp.]